MNTPNAHELRCGSTRCLLDPRTLRRWLAGESVKSTVVARVEQALATDAEFRAWVERFRAPVAEQKAA